MKSEKVILALDCIYLVVMILCSVFYMLADFSKAISRQLGFAQLIFSILAVIILIIGLLIKKAGLPIFVYALYSVAQIIPVTCWIIFSFATFEIFRGVTAINWLGLTVHLLLIAWGAFMIITKKKGGLI